MIVDLVRMCLFVVSFFTPPKDDIPFPLHLAFPSLLLLLLFLLILFGLVWLVGFVVVVVVVVIVVFLFGLRVMIMHE